MVWREFAIVHSIIAIQIEAVKEYQVGFPGEKIIEKYDIRSLSQLKQWSIQYNNVLMVSNI